MNTLRQGDMYYDERSALSPPMHPRQSQSQTLRHQSSRQNFGGFGQQHQPQQSQQGGMYTLDEIASRYDVPRYNERMDASLQSSYNGYDYPPQQGWNTNSYAHNNTLAAIGATTRGKPSSRGRSNLPSMWMDQPQPIAPSGGFSNLGSGQMGMQSMRSETMGSDTDEDLIPTAIVIKNIPFAVKKEQLVQVMTDLCLPLPYAFNYHFDNGVFRGLAFANFTTPEETAAVIHAMNHLDLHGRKLRVEYKKMLPQAERDRIEREKRERRGQLEEQHRPMATTQLHNQPSMSSLSSHIPATSPSPNSSRAATLSLDMNDPITLSYYSKLILFQGDSSQDVLSFPSTLPPTHRKVVHGLAHQLGLGHASAGNGEQRQLHVFRAGNVPAGLSPTADTGNPIDAHRRQLNRAATTDFTNVKSTEPGFYGSPVTQSSNFLGFPESQGGGLSVGSNLRAAKSFHDLRSYTPSPSHSTTSFPAGLANNIARFTDYSQTSTTASRVNNTPSANPGPSTTDSLLINGLNNMNLNNGNNNNNGFGAPSTSPQRLRGMMSWDREVPGPIGGHRTYTANQVDDQNRNRTQGAPTRQPRGPLAERGNGFTRGRQNGHSSRGSDEISPPNGVEILVE